MKKILGMFIAMTLISSCSDAQVKVEQKSNGSITKAAESMQEKQINEVVSADKFKELLSKNEAQVLDVRTPGEFTEGNISNSLNIDYYGSNFKSELSKLDKTKTTLVYCKSGGRSGKAASILKKMGFVEVYDLKGGYSGWPFK